MIWSFWARAGVIVLFLGVSLGAFGAHALKNVLTEDARAIYQSAVLYQFVHGLALFAVAWLATKTEHTLVPAAGWCFLGGILLFSGSLYGLSLSGIRILGAITPLGGLAFLAGWVCLLFARY